MLKILAALIPLLYMAVIWLQSSYSVEELISFFLKQGGSAINIEDPSFPILLIGMVFETLHLVEFGILFFLIAIALQVFGIPWKRVVPFALLTAAAYSVIDEWHQFYVEGRSASWIDLLKDWAGIAIVWFIMNRWQRKKRSKRHTQMSRIGRRA